MAKIFCSKCGTQIEDTASFCFRCGNQIEIENLSNTPNDEIKKTLRNPFTKFIFISLALQIVCLVLSGNGGTFGAVAFWFFLALTVGVLISSILTIIKSKKYNKRGQAVGIVFTTLSSLLITIFVIALLFASPNNNENSSGNSENSTQTQSTEDITQENSKPISTDWNTFECEYYGDLPIGLLSTPDATTEIVQQYINNKKGTNSTFEVKQIYNAYQSCQIEIENLLSVQNCKGTATFLFDWKTTLYKIEFEFDNKAITPAIMQKVHNDIDNIVGGKCATNYLIEKGGSRQHDEISNNNLCSCGWHLQDNLKYKARFTSYFNNNSAMSNTFELERNNYNNATNYEAVDNRQDGSDSITVDGVKISGKYHSASSPYISGTATNNSSKTVSFIKIKIALKDSSGKVTDTVWTYAVGAEGLAPNESTQWKVYCSEAKDIEITVF